MPCGIACENQIMEDFGDGGNHIIWIKRESANLPVDRHG